MTWFQAGFEFGLGLILAGFTLAVGAGSLLLIAQGLVYLWSTRRR